MKGRRFFGLRSQLAILGFLERIRQKQAVKLKLTIRSNAFISFQYDETPRVNMAFSYPAK